MINETKTVYTKEELMKKSSEELIQLVLQDLSDTLHRADRSDLVNYCIMVLTN